ncbi:MAG: hypothetical protein LBR08_01455 [Bacteroidales bacterium]|nr:hypothetical protein [Bacteroidales bacterium]
MEDIARHLRPTLENIPENKVPSPDTPLRSLDEPATDKYDRCFHFGTGISVQYQ